METNNRIKEIENQINNLNEELKNLKRQKEPYYSYYIVEYEGSPLPIVRLGFCTETEAEETAKKHGARYREITEEINSLYCEYEKLQLARDTINLIRCHTPEKYKTIMHQIDVYKRDVLDEILKKRNRQSERG